MKESIDIIDKALRLGACKKIENKSSIRELVELFFSPQGIEFCEKNDFPNIDMLRSLKNEISEFGIYVDSGLVMSVNEKDIALAGNTNGELTYDKNSYVNTIILMHGATAKITASKYTVLNIIIIGDCSYEIEKDDTVILL